MRYSAVLALAAPLIASAAPTRFNKRDDTANALLVFTFADVLEQLESSFYQEALAKFQPADFTSAGFISADVAVQQFNTIAKDEATHSTVLQAGLKSFGAQPVTSCKFDFSSALTDVATMAATARVVEQVGVAAYLGAATLLADPVLLTSAASILTIEARHQSILNVLNGGSAIPSAFDIPMTPSEVLAIAGPFISGCDLGIPANVPLSLTNTGTVAPGTTLTFSASSLNGTVSDDKLHCHMIVGGATNSIVFPMSQCVVPEGINGPVALFITSDDQPLINNVRDRATTQMVAGPTFAFIDTETEILGGLARGNTQSIINGAATGTATAPESAATGASGGAGQPPAAVAPAAGPIFATGPNSDSSITVNGWSSASA